MIDVSSHAVNSVIRSSATTMPSIAPANSVEQAGEAIDAVAVVGVRRWCGPWCAGAKYHHE